MHHDAGLRAYRYHILHRKYSIDLPEHNAPGKSSWSLLLPQSAPPYDIPATLWIAASVYAAIISRADSLIKYQLYDGRNGNCYDRCFREFGISACGALCRLVLRIAGQPAIQRRRRATENSAHFECGVHAQVSFTQRLASHRPFCYFSLARRTNFNYTISIKV